MQLYPDSVYFFINCWTWGYEDILKAIARAFQVKVKRDFYCNITLPIFFPLDSCRQIQVLSLSKHLGPISKAYHYTRSLFNPFSCM